MKVIPKKELIFILDKMFDDLIFKDQMDMLFSLHGDDYFRDPGKTDYRLIRECANRKLLLEDIGMSLANKESTAVNLENVGGNAK